MMKCGAVGAGRVLVHVTAGGPYTAGSQAIAQMFIYGNSLREYLLAIVVPTVGAPLCC